MHKRGSLRVLLKKARGSIEETRAVHKEVTEKKAARRAKKADAEPVVDSVKKPSPTFTPRQVPLSDAVKTEKSGQTKKDAVNWKSVHDWFKEGIMRNNPDWLCLPKVPYRDKKERGSQKAGFGVLAWTGAEINCANRLLDRYGAEGLEKAVGWMCDNWRQLVDNSNGFFKGAPSVRVLWSQRDAIVPDALAGKKVVPRKRPVPKKVPKVKRHMVGEYDAESAAKLPLVGWGDEGDV